MDHTTMWLAHERTAEARQRAAETRLARAARTPTVRSLVRRIRNGR
jgi:hypothetical protein